jgi:diguanylate cyclase (GGDEF)-like protein/PAS domain S-box-containing protein
METPDRNELPDLRHHRRVTVPISFTGDIAGFLFDLLSGIEAIVWEADADTLTIEFVNDRLCDLLGYEPMDVVAVPEFWSSTIVHPDDREAFLASQDEVLRTGVARLTYRAVATDGSVVWLSSVAHLTIDQEGRRRVRGLETDVTAMKRAEDDARDSEERFRLLSDASRDSVVVHAGDSIVEVNQAFCDQFGWAADEALRLDPSDYISPESIAIFRERLASGSTDSFEVTGRHRSGARRWYSARSREARYHGSLARVVVLTDITDLKQREQRALHDASHDHLTGLRNRGAFGRRLDEELARLGDDRTLGMLFCDLNGFKAVNDTHGHAAGDALLQLVGQRLGSLARASDPVYRIGGDEFVILLPDLPPEDCVRVLERMRRRVGNVFAAPFAIGPAAVEIGVAVGTAVAPVDGVSADVLVRRADLAMYEHKRAMKARAT